MWTKKNCVLDFSHLGWFCCPWGNKKPPYRECFCSEAVPIMQAMFLVRVLKKARFFIPDQVWNSEFHVSPKCGTWPTESPTNRKPTENQKTGTTNHPRKLTMYLYKHLTKFYQPQGETESETWPTKERTAKRTKIPYKGMFSCLLIQEWHTKMTMGSAFGEVGCAGASVSSVTHVLFEFIHPEERGGQLDLHSRGAWIKTKKMAQNIGMQGRALGCKVSRCDVVCKSINSDIALQWWVNSSQPVVIQCSLLQDWTLGERYYLVAEHSRLQKGGGAWAQDPKHPTDLLDHPKNYLQSCLHIQKLGLDWGVAATTKSRIHVWDNDIVV